MSENTDDSQEWSEGGSPILRHQARERGFELATGDGESLQVIDAHLEKYIGTPTTVFHELISWAVIPHCPEEMDLKLKRGVEALYPGFDKNGISELVQLDRPSVGEQSLPRKKLFGLV